ncbi:NmrA family NAD(P)-binding protein [Lentzea sp. HUAS12]|uniref:NmrA family NAD(P)-binding protein n=1 Tax=Lentzea sp. HUAS12 TaxID=2951806 RepID=UPI0020A037CF|nr:NmrA family NAD(P)-binding protein [Lentzea sp. HUAS12]USX54403.1 NmrA family NAD(P)-binding protein [Lentzea sp. HUAS12]
MTSILVTGATGRHGGTGAHVVRRLREEGRDVRVLARSRGDRTEALEAIGAEVVIGDLQDRRGIVPALEGVAQAYFTYPIDAGVIGAAANFAAAVRESGASPRTVVMSMGPAHPGHPSGRGRDQWLAEEVPPVGRSRPAGPARRGGVPRERPRTARAVRAGGGRDPQLLR